MKMEKFEDTLFQMTKPEVSQLKHQDRLANAITKARDKTVLSWWWLSIPIYMLAMLLMKSFFMPSTTLLSNLGDMESKQKYCSVLFFVIMPLIFILINLMSMKKIYFLSGSPKSLSFLKVVWFNVLIIMASVLILIIYSL